MEPPGATTAFGGLNLDLEVFQGPFDLLTTLVLEEEIDLLEVDLADVVLAYVDHLERAGELDLEATTEFLVLISALLLLKSRLLLPVEQEDPPKPEQGEAVDELLARMVEYARYRGAAGHLRAALEAESGHRYRSAPLPPELRRASLEGAVKAYEAGTLAVAVGGLLRVPAPVDLSHVARPAVSLDARLARLRELLRGRGRFAFDDAVEGSGDRVTVAITLFALLELYKSGEADWEQAEPFGPISVSRR